MPDISQAELYRHVNAIAEAYVDEEKRKKYIQAAKNFRMPYWDWALPTDAGIGVLPKEALSSTKHRVIRPENDDGNPEINPLASYKFQSTDEEEEEEEGEEEEEKKENKIDFVSVLCYLGLWSFRTC
jgi:hypothetical protein